MPTWRRSVPRGFTRRRGCTGGPGLVLQKKRGYFINRSRNITQSLQRLNAERQVRSLIPGAAPVLWVLQLLRNKGTAFALQTTRPSCGSDENAEMATQKKSVSREVLSFSTFMFDTLMTLK